MSISTHTFLLSDVYWNHIISTYINLTSLTMDAAKEAISKLTSHHGHHTTEVHEHYQPAVTHEHVSRTREHEGTTVLDKEIHQDHHHTTVLPVKDQEILPTGANDD